MWDSLSKERAIKEITRKDDIDLSLSYAYGDTTGDFTMFKLVGFPICINPTKELLKKIWCDKEIKQRIKIIIERKDVVYTMNPETLDFQ